MNFKLKISVKLPELKLAQEMVEHTDWDRVSLVVNFRIRDPHTSEKKHKVFWWKSISILSFWKFFFLFSYLWNNWRGSQTRIWTTSPGCIGCVRIFIQTWKTKKKIMKFSKTQTNFVKWWVIHLYTNLPNDEIWITDSQLDSMYAFEPQPILHMVL